MKGFLGAAFRSFAGRILGALSALLAAYSVTSNLSIDESGIFFLSLGFAIFFSHLLRFGLDNFVLKKCAIFLSDNGYRDFLAIATVSAFICIGGSILVYMLMQGSSWVVSYEYMQYLLLVFPAAIAVALLGIVAHTFHASGFVFTGAATNTSLNYVLFTAYIWLLGVSDASDVIQLYIAACFSALFIQLAVALVIYKSNGIKLSHWKDINFSQVNYREIYQTTLPLWFVVIAQQLNQWGAQFIASVNVEEKDLALLAIAMRIALLVPMVLTAVNMVVSPQFAALHHKGEIEKTEEVLAKALKLLAAVSSLVFFVMILFGDNVLAIFGEQYVAAASLLAILVCGQLVNALTGPCGKLLMMSGYEKDVRNSSMVVAAVGVCLALVLTSTYGVYGAAMATALTIAVQNLAFAFLVKHRLQINLLRTYSKFFK